MLGGKAEESRGIHFMLYHEAGCVAVDTSHDISKLSLQNYKMGIAAPYLPPSGDGFGDQMMQ